MPADDRDVLEILRGELDFLELGGYQATRTAPWVARSIFRDSPTCLNFGDPTRHRPCDECLLTALVPEERISEEIPCHHIPLNPDGETINQLERDENPEMLEQKLKDWLRRMIRLLEAARSGPLKP